MKILKVNQLIEAKGYPGLSKNFRKQGSYEVTAIKDGNIINFKGSTIGDIYTNIIDWLFKNGYTFNGPIHIAKVRKIFSSSGIESESSYSFSDFYEFTDDKYLLIRKINASQIMSNIKLMFNNFDVTDVKFIGFSEEESISEVPEIENNKIFSKNPFRQAICVLGGSGAGKSTTIENILDEEGHEFEFIIPSASTTGLLSQFSPSKSGYIPSKLGKMIVNAYNNPTQLFTAVFDECHKSNVIEMINDELLQAISDKRNNGNRFISLDDDTAELYPGTEKHRGNILIPDNLGFIFISSKPNVIIHNDDFFRRIDIVELYKEERLENIEQLLSKRLDNDRKKDLKSDNE